MVQIADVVIRTSVKNGSEFLSLTIVGDLDIITSPTTGRQFLSAMKCNITSNLPISMGSSLVGKTLEGNVVRVNCPEYEWTNPSTAEVVKLSHTYRYQKSPMHQPTGENVVASAPVITKPNTAAIHQAGITNVTKVRLAELSGKKTLTKAEQSEKDQLIAELLK
jgi:hypothetical protein